MNQLQKWRNETNERRRRQITAMGIDEVRLKEREKKRKQRAKNKPKDAVSNSHDVEKLMDEITDEIKDYTFKTIEKSNDKNTIMKVKQDIPKVIRKPKLLNIKTIDSLEVFVNKLTTDSLKKNDRDINVKTLKQYANKLRVLHENMFDKKAINFNNLDWLSDVSKVKKFIINKYGTEKTTSLGYFIAITSILGRIMDFQDEHKQYNKIMMDLKKKFR